MRVVVDASVLLAVVRMEPHRDVLLAKTAGVSLVAPSLLPGELGNALFVMEKRRRAAPDDLLQVWEIFQEIPVEQVAIDVGEALELAMRLRIYAYDAYLIRCALEQHLPLLTMDQGLRQAAQACFVDVWEVDEP